MKARESKQERPAAKSASSPPPQAALTARAPQENDPLAGSQFQHDFTAVPSQFGGDGQEVPYRSALESAYGEDFSSVRAFPGRRSLLDSMGAKAATSGEEVAFSADRPSRRLVAHELAHVVQNRRHPQANGNPVAPPGSPAERDAERASALAVSGGRALVTAAPAGALALSAKNPFDDPVAFSSSAEAAKAMKAYQALSAAERRAAVAASYKLDLVRVLNALSSIDQVQTFVDSLREIMRWVEEEETHASLGKTDDQIAGEQAKFMIKKATDDAKAAAAAAAKLKGVKAAPPTPAEIKQALKDSVSATSIAPAVGGWWISLSAADKKAWEARGKAAIGVVVAHAAAKHSELKITAANFKLDFPAVEARGLNVVALGNPAQVGKAFVVAAELNPAYVMDVVVHEVFGHPEYGRYGSEYHLALYDAASAKVPGYVKPAEGTKDRKTETDAFAYQETETYAVLRSMAYRTAPTKADAPNVPNLDSQVLVDWRVGLMKKQWAPSLIVGILRGFRKRLVLDPRITAAALKVFDQAVLTNFDAKTQAEVKK